jgi:hypothetical protein
MGDEVEAMRWTRILANVQSDLGQHEEALEIRENTLELFCCVIASIQSASAGNTGQIASFVADLKPQKNHICSNSEWLCSS